MQCAICDNSIKLLEHRLELEDGVLCSNCVHNSDLSPLFSSPLYAKRQKAVKWGQKHTIEEFIKTQYHAPKKVETSPNQHPANRNAGAQQRPKHNVTKSDDVQISPTQTKLQKIAKQLQDGGSTDFFGTKKEVYELPNILDDDEIAKYATSGFVDGNTVLVVCTDQRVLFIDKGMLYGIRSTEIPMDMVNSVNYSMAIMFGKVSIVNGAKETLVENVDKKTAPILAKKIKEARDEFMIKQNQPNQSIQAITQTAPKEKSVGDQLRELKSLLDDGIITQDDFDAKKKQLLGL